MRLAIALMCILITGCKENYAEEKQRVRDELTARCKQIGGDTLDYPASLRAIRLSDGTDFWDCIRLEPNDRKVVAVYVVTGEIGSRKWEERAATK